MSGVSVTELRLVVTAENYQEALTFYRDVLGLGQLAEFDSPDGHVVLLDAGRATLELTDPGNAAYVDQVGELQRRPARVEKHDVAVGRVELGELGEPEHVPVEGQRLRVVLGGDDKPQLGDGHVGHCAAVSRSAKASSRSASPTTRVSSGRPSCSAARSAAARSRSVGCWASHTTRR